MISPEDVELLHVTDDPAEAVRIVVASYDERNARRLAGRAGEGRRAVAARRAGSTKYGPGIERPGP